MANCRVTAREADLIGWALRQFLLWGLAAATIYVIAAASLHRGAVSRQGAAAPARTVQPALPTSLVFHANHQGHVIVDGVANGAAMRFLVDTGATLVALTSADAAAAGIGPGSLRFTGTVSTANGTARVAPIRLRELRIGQFSTTDVSAVVIENLNISLLGQSFLKRLDSYEMRDGVLTMNWN